MDESLQAFLQNLLSRPGNPEDDYRDMLANYMNQQNQAWDQGDDFEAALSMLPRDRLAGASQYAPGNLSAEGLPPVKESRQQLNDIIQRLLRGQ